MDIVLFDFMTEYLAKIQRLIKQPQANGIIIGLEGSGTSSLIQLAVFMCNGFQSHEVKLEANYTLEDWQNELKSVLQTAGLDEKEIVFRVKHSVIFDDQIMHDLNTLMNNSEVSGIFSKEEYESIISSTLIHMPRERGAQAGKVRGFGKSRPDNALILNQFNQKCRENLKVLLSFPPTGADLRTRMRSFKSISNCSTIIWMEQWPQEGYKQVAEGFLKEDVTSRDIIIGIAVNIHREVMKIAKDYYLQTQHYLYITPNTFSDFVKTYQKLFDQKKESLTTLQQRYENGLDRLKTTQEAVENYQEKLENKSPELIEKQIEVEKLLANLKEEEELLRRRKNFLKKEEETLNIQKQGARQMKEECEEALEGALPDLFQAVSQLKQLNKADMTELRSMRNPPNAVRSLMESICILLDVEPIKIKSMDGIGFIWDYWLAATGKHVLGNPKLIEKLTKLDQNNLKVEIMQRLDELLNTEDFTLENISRASIAASSMFKWLQSLRYYHQVFRQIAPKRNALFSAEEQVQQREEMIKQNKREMTVMEENLEELRSKHQVMEAEIEILNKEIVECRLKQERANKLLAGLGGEKQKWLVCNRMIAKKFITIQGDVLLGAAFMTYLSSFTQKFRDSSVEKWERMIRQLSIRVSEDYNFNKIFGDQLKIKEWQLNYLPSDSFSISNAIILEASDKQCVMIDPQYQANKWIRQQERQHLKILTFSDSNFMQIMELGMKFGKPILIENIGEKIDISIQPIFKNEYQIIGGIRQYYMFGHTIEMDNAFKLYLTSEQRNPHFGPDISVYSRFINFYVTLEGLEAQMLSLIISYQKAALEEETVKNKKEAFNYIKKLKGLEEDILTYLAQDIDEILSDENLIETLSFSKRTAKSVATNLQKVNKTTNIILKSRGIYTPGAFRAAQLYFLLSDLQQIKKMYQFSLKWFTEIFIDEVKTIKRTDQDPLLDIIRNFTFSFYQKVCQSIFQQDKMLFTFLMVFRILEGEQCLNKKLFDFFVQGPKRKGFGVNTGNDSDLTSDNESSDSDVQAEKQALKVRRKKECPFLNENHWLAVEALSKIPPFNRPDLSEHILDNPKAWQTYLQQKETENIQIPGSYTDQPLDGEATKGGLMRKKVLREATKRISQKQQSGKGGGGLKPKAAKSTFQKKKLNSVLGSDESQSFNSELADSIGELDAVKRPSKGSKGSRAIDDTIWDLDDGEDEQTQTKEEKGSDGDDVFGDDAEMQFDSLVEGVEDYNEFRLGSVKYEKDQILKKKQVYRDLLKFCLIRCFKPEKMVRELSRFFGSVLDARLMEPAPTNLLNLFKETHAGTPILFLMSQGINTLSELETLRSQLSIEHQKIQYMPLGSNMCSKAEELILSSAKKGQWVLLENLHLVTEWIPTLQKFISTMLREDIATQEREAAEILAKKQAQLNKYRSRTSIVQETETSKTAEKSKQDGETQKNQEEFADADQEMVMKQQQELNIQQFPILRNCRISPRFRLWLSSMPVDYFPVNFLQDCVKITLQPSKGVKQNALKILNSVKPDFLTSMKTSSLSAKLGKIFYSLALFHGVMVERNRYGPIGWSQPYQFSSNDFDISSIQLANCLKRTGDIDQVSYPLLRYLIGELNYGGRTSKFEDQSILDEILKTFISKRVIENKHFNLSGLDQQEHTVYYVPSETDIDSLKLHAQKLPLQDKPEIFGLHEFSTITRAISEGKQLLERVFEFEFASKVEINKQNLLTEGEDSLTGKYSKVKKQIQVIIQELPSLIDEEEAVTKYPISKDKCMNILLSKEIQRFNMLLQVIYVSLKNTLKALDGVIHMNQTLEQIYTALTLEQVPQTWLKYSYPSYKSLSLYMENLKERVLFIEGWVKKGHPQTYNISCFFDQRSFFTSLLQQKARTEQVSIDDLQLGFEVTEQKSWAIPKKDSEKLVIIYGLWLEGCSWSQKNFRVEDIPKKAPKEMMWTEMPLIRVEVMKVQDFDLKYNYFQTMNALAQKATHNTQDEIKKQYTVLKTQDSMLKSISEKSKEEPVQRRRVNINTGYSMKPKWMEYVHVPLYKIGLRETLDGDFDTGLIRRIPLPIGEITIEEAKSQLNDEGSLSMLQSGNHSKNFWVKRGVALVCLKED